MPDLAIDTHSAIWYLVNSPEMSVFARQTLDDAAVNGNTIILSAISIVEIVYLIDKRRIAPQTLPRLMQYLKLPNSSFAMQDLTESIAEFVQQIPRSIVPDMPDRIIAATALHLGLPLVTKDSRIQSLTIVQTIW